MWKIYKEGQGKWARGILAFTVGLGALFAASSLHDALPAIPLLPVLNWKIDYRFLIEGPLLIGAVIFGVWMFNHPPAVDFLIDAESELKNKVVWPSKQEEINASMVVVITVIILMAFYLGVDFMFTQVREWAYQESKFNTLISTQ